MATSGISTSTNQAFQTAPAGKQRGQEFKALSDALQSGDLSAAQQAFAALKNGKSGQGNGQGAGQGGNKPDMSALEQALQQGDLAGAQAAFDKFKTDAQAAHGGHHHQKAGSSATSESAAPVTSNNGGISIKV